MKKKYLKLMIGLILSMTLMLGHTIQTQAVTVNSYREQDGFYANMHLERSVGSGGAGYVSNGRWFSSGTYLPWSSWIHSSNVVSWNVPNRSYNMYVEGIYTFTEPQQSPVTRVLGNTFYNFY